MALRTDGGSMLERDGVPVSVASASASALVTPANEEILEDGTPTGAVQTGVWIVYEPSTETGKLGADVDTEAEIVVSAGPLAGTYHVNRVEALGNGSLIQILAR